MTHLTLGLGIVLSVSVLKPLYHALTFRSGAVVNQEFYFRQRLGELIGNFERPYDMAGFFLVLSALTCVIVWSTRKQWKQL